MHSFISEQWLPYPVETVFSFFSNPENLPSLMPEWQKTRVEHALLVAPPPPPEAIPGSPRSVAAGARSQIKLSFRPFPFSPLRLSWLAEIQDFTWNASFSDYQMKGPFTYWKHRHSVQAETGTGADGQEIQGTRLVDEVSYKAPLGPLGVIADALFLRAQLRATFAFRHSRTLELLSRGAR